jgi:hypothetical protein
MVIDVFKKKLVFLQRYYCLLVEDLTYLLTIKSKLYES